MTKQTINLGTAANNGNDGDDARTAFSKVNDNFTEVYALAGGAQPVNAKLTALASAVWAANQLQYQSGAGTVANTPLTVAARALLDDADSPAMRVTLGLGGQILQALQALTMTANGVPYMASASTMAIQASTAYGRSLWSAANAAGAKSLLALGNAADATLVDGYNDSTQGRVLVVGAHGVGSYNAPGTLDLNVLEGGGINGISSGTLNSLLGYGSGSLLHTMQFSSAEAFQFMSKREATGRFAVRRMVSGNFGTWVEPLLPGDGGLLTTTLNFEAGADTWYGNRFKGWNGTAATEGPPVSVVSYGVDLGYSTNRRFKMAIDLNGSPWFTGGTAIGVVNNWKKGLLTSDMVGTVSQVSGVPTGAIIERGANTNGEYVRYADGTQIVWKYNVSMPSAAVNTSTQIAVTYPMVFAASSSICNTASASPLSSFDCYGVIGTANNSATGIIFVARNGATSAQGFSLSYMAIGRWF